MKPMIAEFGFGTSLRQQNYTQAAIRAVHAALWRNSINVAELMGFEKSDMQVLVRIGVQKPDAVNPAQVAAVFPYGNVEIETVFGGLDIPRADGSITVMAQASLRVAFAMHRQEQGASQ